MTNGHTGKLPEYYNVSKAAQYWGISPDEIIRLPSYWVYVADIIIDAELQVKENKEKTASKKNNKKGGISGLWKRRR